LACESPRVVLMLVGPEREVCGAGGDDRDELRDLAFDGTRVGTAVERFEPGALATLGVAHAAAAADIGVGEAVRVVAVLAGEEVEQGGVVLAPFEALKAVEVGGFVQLALGAQLLMEEQAVATEARGNAADGLRRDAELASDLTEAGAAQEPMRDRKQELGQLRPVAGAKRLFGEVTPAVTALESLDAVWVRAAQEESCTDPAPRSRWLGVEWAGWVGAERGRRVNRRCGHAVGHCKLQAFRNLLSTTQFVSRNRRTKFFPGTVILRKYNPGSNPAAAIMAPSTVCRPAGNRSSARTSRSRPCRSYTAS